jgi:hypothetical protein
LGNLYIWSIAQRVTSVPLGNPSGATLAGAAGKPLAMVAGYEVMARVV